MNQKLAAALAGRYSIERELGGGGMSRVFVATETELARSVVIKVIAPELAGDLSGERFAREVRLAARLQQANIVPVLSAGDADGLPYYTMPFVRGHSLRARLSHGGALAIAEAVSICRDVARALAYAHEEGVAHRDIKPENILLSGGTAVVTDFGIAKALSASRTLDGSPAVSTMLTQAGGSIGTPAYMAPEQAAADPGADHRVDIYAWGIIAWEMLAGRHPFAGRTTPQAMLAAHIAESPEPLAQVRPEAPPQLTALVARCLAKDPAQRPATGAELLTALESIATPSTTGDLGMVQSSRKSRRHLIGGIAAATLVVAGLAAYTVFSGDRAATTGARTIVVVPFENLGASNDAYFAEGVTEEIAARLARVPGLQVVARASVKKFHGSSTPPREIARQLGAAYALSGTIRWARPDGNAPGAETQVRIVPSLVSASSGAQVWGEPLQENLDDIFKAQADIAERVASALSVTIGAEQRATLRRPESRDRVARESTMLGYSLVERRGLENLRRAIVHFDRAIARDSAYARAWAGRSEAYRLLPSYLDTLTMNEAEAIAEPSARRALALDSLLPEAHSALATLLHDRPNQALRSVDRAIELDRGSAMAWSRRGTLLLLLGRVKDAEAPLRRAQELDPLVGAHTGRLVWWHLAAGRVDSIPVMMERFEELDPDNTIIPYIGAAAFAQGDRADLAVRTCVRYGDPKRDCEDLWIGLVDPRQRSRAVALLESPGRERVTLLRLPSFLALAFARAGMVDSAFRALRDASTNRDANLFTVINSQWMMPLHRDPRWDQIVGEIRRR